MIKKSKQNSFFDRIKFILKNNIKVITFISLFIMIGNWVNVSVPIKPFGIHAGLWGLIFNCMVIFIINQYELKRNITLA